MDLVTHLSPMTQLFKKIFDLCIREFYIISYSIGKKRQTERALWLINGFISIVLESKLVDVHMEGCPFTWFKSISSKVCVLMSHGIERWNKGLSGTHPFRNNNKSLHNKTHHNADKKMWSKRMVQPDEWWWRAGTG